MPGPRPQEGFTGKPQEGFTGKPQSGFTGKPQATPDDDVEGHGFGQRPQEGFTGKPQEGFTGKPQEGFTGKPQATPDEDDVEGHQMLPMDVGSARHLAAARENEIRRHLARHEMESEGRRPHKRER